MPRAPRQASVWAVNRLWTAAALAGVALAGFGLAGCAIGNTDRASTLTLPTTRAALTTVTEAHTTTLSETLTQTTTETRNHVMATTVATTVTAVTTAPPQTVVLTVAQPATTTQSEGPNAAWGWVVILLLVALVTIGIIWLVRGHHSKEA
jgi:hypothetical protein